MIKIDTNRLKLLALDLEHLKLLKQDRVLLEKNLEIEFSDHQVSIDTKREIESELIYKLEDVQENPQQFEWFTSWEIILKEKNLSVGSIGLFGFPDKNGTSTISYYIDERYRNIGYATEALIAMVKWSFTNKKLLQIVAETHCSNYSSNRVLSKCGFKIINTNKDIMYWELKKLKDKAKKKKVED